MEIEKFYGTFAWFDLSNSTEFIINSNPREIGELFGSYYQIINREALKHSGRIVDQLGDGIGVLFKTPKSSSRACNMVLNFPESIDKLSLKWRVGMGYGLITCIYNKPNSFLERIYSSKPVIYAYLLGNTRIKKGNVRITENVYRNLGEKQRSFFKPSEPITLKGGLCNKTFYH